MNVVWTCTRIGLDLIGQLSTSRVMKPESPCPLLTGKRGKQLFAMGSRPELNPINPLNKIYMIKICLPRVQAKIIAAITDLGTVSMEILEMQGVGLLDGYTRKCLYTN